MSKKYLINEENIKDIDPKEIGFNAAFDKGIAKEVEVLDDDNCDFCYEDFHLKSPLQYFSDYLKANNYLIVKAND